MTVISLSEKTAFIAEAMALEVWHGPNLYSRFLRDHFRRPTPDEAAAIGAAMGTRVRASDGKKYPVVKA